MILPFPQLNDTLAGQTFVGNIGSAFTAGQFAHVQLFNPAASGKVLYVFKLIMIATTATMRFGIGHHNTALTTVGGANGNFDNGGAATVAELRRQSNASSLFTNIINGASELLIQEDFDLSLTPFVVDEGQGLGVQANTVDQDFVIDYFWVER